MEYYRERRSWIRPLFITTAFHFFQDIWSSIIRRLPFTNDIVMDLDCLIIRDRGTAFSSMRKLGLFFNNIISQAELGAFMNEVDNLEREGELYQKRAELKRYSLLEFWKEEQEDFPLLYRLSRAIQVLPYSTASIERNFSTMRLIKTVRRNLLGTNNLVGCLLAKQYFKDKEIVTTPDMLRRYQIKSAAVIPSSQQITNSEIPIQIRDQKIAATKMKT